MSRRESRVSLGARQNDALVEFESFKKKFLLANKHITKLNSTLSVRIEELNAQISTLYVENLRLRASEIALTAQLKREREKSSRVMADAEAATQNLTKHLSYLRQTLNIHHSPSTQSLQGQSTKTKEREKREGKEGSPTHSPPRTRPVNVEPRDEALRVARAPNVPGIDEEEEPPTDDYEHVPVDPPRIRTSTKRPSSTPQIPLPTMTSIPATGPRKKSNSTMRRRESGLLLEMSVRPGSPTVGSPVQKELDVDADEDGGVVGEDGEDEPLRGVTRRKQKSGGTRGEDEEEEEEYRPTKRKQKDDNREKDHPAEKKERKRRTPPKDVDADEVVEEIQSKVEREKEKEKKVKSKTQARLVDVTNSPRGSVGLSLRSEDVLCTAAGDPLTAKPRTFLAPRPSSTTSTSSSQSTHPVSSSSTKTQTSSLLPDSLHHEPLNAEPSSKVPSPFFLPTPRTSSSPPPEVENGLDEELPDETTKANVDGGTEAGGRERRARKSVNYAEPKLNTKMRKPDPPPGTTTTTTKSSKKRSSTFAASSSTTPALTSLSDGVDVNSKGKRKRGSDGVDAEDGMERKGGSADEHAPWVEATFVVRTRKFQPKPSNLSNAEDDDGAEDYEDDEDDEYKEESAGEQADGEFTVRKYRSRSGTNTVDVDGFANVDQSRRRGDSSSRTGVATGAKGRRRGGGSEAGGGLVTDGEWEDRRHSMAV